MITGQVLSKLRRALRNNSKSDVCAVLCDVDLTSTSYEGYEPGVPLLHLLLQHPDVDVPESLGLMHVTKSLKITVLIPQ